MFLAQEAVSDRLPYMKKTIPSRVTGKCNWHDVEFEKERAWLVDHIMDKGKETEEPEEKDGDYTYDDEECEDGVECGCCFSKFVFVSLYSICTRVCCS